MSSERMEEMTLADLRQEAKTWGISGIGKLSKQQLLKQIRQARRLAALPIAELRNQARSWKVRGSSKMEKEQLVPRLLQIERLRAMTVPELRERARQREVEKPSRLKKDELIRRLIQSEEAVPLQPAAQEMPAAPRGRTWMERIGDIPWRRALGLVMRISGALGIFVSVLLLLAIPILSAKTVPVAEGALDSMVSAIRQTAQTLDLSAHAMGRAAEVLDTGNQTLRVVDASIQDTQPLLNSVGQLVGDQAPQTIEITQAALESAVEGAQAIDQVLRTLARLGPLTGVRYDPEAPLEQSLSEAAAGLEPLPATLRDIRMNLDSASAELEDMRTVLGDVAEDSELFSIRLRRLEADMDQKADTLTDQAIAIERLRGDVARWLWWVTLAAELLILWTGMAQVAVYLMGESMQGKAAP